MQIMMQQAEYITLHTLDNDHISYFALIIIGYITDVYWEKFEPQKNPGKLLLFASYFPQMTSGPIVQYEMMQDNLWGEKHRFSYERMISGLERVIWGIFKNHETNNARNNGTLHFDSYPFPNFFLKAFLIFLKKLLLCKGNII